MNRHFPNKNHWRAFYLFRLGALMLFTAIPARGGVLQRTAISVPAARTPQARKPAAADMRVDEAKMTATAVDCPLQNTFREPEALKGTRESRHAAQTAVRKLPASKENDIWGFKRSIPKPISNPTLERRALLGLRFAL